MKRRLAVFLLLLGGCAGAADPGRDAGGVGDAAAVLPDAGIVTDAGGMSPDAGPLTPDAGAPVLGVVSPKDLHDALPAKDFLLVNVHIPYEGNVPQTDKSIPYNDVAALVAYLGTDLDVKVTLYCKSNSMSGLAGNELVKRGYRAVRYLDGGMNGWVAAGYALEK